MEIIQPARISILSIQLMKRLKLNSLFFELPFDCWYEISRFLESFKELNSLFLSVKGFYDFFKRNGNNTKSISYSLTTVPPKSTNGYTHVQNLIVKNEKFREIRACLGAFFPMIRILNLQNITTKPILTLQDGVSPGLVSFVGCKYLEKVQIKISRSCKFDVTNLHSLEYLGIRGLVITRCCWSVSRKMSSHKGDDPIPSITFRGKPHNLKHLSIEQTYLPEETIARLNNLESLEIINCDIPRNIYMRRQKTSQPILISSSTFPKLKHLSIRDILRDRSWYKFQHGSAFELQTFRIVQDEGCAVSFNWDSLSMKKMKVFEFTKSLPENLLFDIIHRIHTESISLRTVTLCLQSIKKSLNFSNYPNLRNANLKNYSYYDRKQNSFGSLSFIDCKKLKKIAVSNSLISLILSNLPEFQSLHLKNWDTVDQKCEFRMCPSICKLTLENSIYFPTEIKKSELEELNIIKCHRNIFCPVSSKCILNGTEFSKLQEYKQFATDDTTIITRGAYLSEFRNLSNLKKVEFEWFERDCGVVDVTGLCDDIEFVLKKHLESDRRSIYWSDRKPKECKIFRGKGKSELIKMLKKWSSYSIL